MNEPGLRIGLDPIERVFVMENHDQAYRIWRNAGAKSRILIHIDAHHDMWWAEDTASIHIANFVCLALKENIAREVFWVVPDASWETAKSRGPILRHLRRITKRYPGMRHGFQVGNSRISTMLLGKPLTVCPLGSLSRMDESVLLDIDADFLVIPRVSYGEIDTQGELPWCWPEDLLNRLRAQNLSADLVTIAYSVQGGYTPLKWKYLADELVLRLSRPDQSEPGIRGMKLIREGATAARRGELAMAEAKYQEAANLLPTSPAPYHHLAHLYLRMDRLADGQKLYQQALTLDPSYRTPYNSAGLLYHLGRRFREAEQEHLRTLALDPQDAYAYLGLGKLAALRKRWKEAEALLRKALSLDHRLTDAYRALGDVLAQRGRLDEAIVAYERSLKSALAGHKPLEEPIVTVMDPGHDLRDRDHGLIHARLARLYERKGNINEAINGYRISVVARYDGVAVRSRLARLYLKQSQWRKSVQEFWRAVKLIPAAVWEAGQNLRRAVHRARTRFLADRKGPWAEPGHSPG